MEKQKLTTLMNDIHFGLKSYPPYDNVQYATLFYRVVSRVTFEIQRWMIENDKAGGKLMDETEIKVFLAQLAAIIQAMEKIHENKIIAMLQPEFIEWMSKQKLRLERMHGIGTNMPPDWRFDEVIPKDKAVSRDYKKTQKPIAPPNNIQERHRLRMVQVNRILTSVTQ